MGITQLDRNRSGHDMAAFHPKRYERGDALALLGIAQDSQFLGEHVHLNLAVMRAGRTNQVARHHMVGEGRRIGRLAFRQAIRQPRSAVGIEGVARKIVVVGSDLRECAA